ncbi:FAD-dependent oxidoreductase [Kiloniella laminariae]|uniref:FAD-dependent oxidoreductase n=1 Tax=Kiloniella laminariae TaxID=454162 RepID=A0ABT4LN63_9PROT|nr:FAD-dependent oxidoreductase [Kiloniella laminariae]MCZ4282528.1 FAD-dependent oxidoreductase [Kiloniella laminariae]
MYCENIIIGGGISGLYLAYRLHQAGKDFLLLEARDRLGGRILAHHPISDKSSLDFGPTWFWPGQEQMEKLVQELAVPVFNQQNQSDILYEDPFVTAERIAPQAFQIPSNRLEGGMIQLIEKLVAALPPHKLLLSHQVHAITHPGDHTPGCVQVETIQGNSPFSSPQIFITLPPRLSAKSINFHPPLPEHTTSAMLSIPTWMAGQAKALITFEQPFWREQNLSGQAFSRIGPMMEIHDASAKETAPYALFGFLGGSALTRSELGEEELVQAIKTQLVRLFGKNAQTPLDVAIKDWGQDPHTATTEDQNPLKAHPEYTMPESLKNLWEGQIIFCGTEVAQRDGGYLEGALVSVNDALSKFHIKH